jgi:hypothetical protein
MGCQPSRPAHAAGGGFLNSSSKFETIGDSVHVMLEHDKKVCATRGQSVCGYVPRPPHPLLDASVTSTNKQRPHGPAVVVEEEEEDNSKNDINKPHHDNDNDEDAEGRTVDLSQTDESVGGEKHRQQQQRRRAPRETAEEARRRLLWHTAHHCATVDPRDVRLVGSSRSLRIPAAAAVVGAA